MKRTTIFLSDDLIARLAAEATRTNVKVAELIRRAVDAVTPPIGTSMGELVKVIDRVGLLKVFVLNARSGKLLVSPGDEWADINIWVDANLVSFPKAESQTIDATGSTPAHLLAPRPTAAWDGLKMNLASSPKSAAPILSESIPAPVPTTCGICGEPFPSKAAKRRHVRDAHATTTPNAEEPKA